MPAIELSTSPRVSSRSSTRDGSGGREGTAGLVYSRYDRSAARRAGSAGTCRDWSRDTEPADAGSVLGLWPERRVGSGS